MITFYNYTFPIAARGGVFCYVTREPNLRVKRSCTSLGNFEAFLFGLIVLKDYVLVWTLSRLLYDWSDVT
jgi:hypothetical protein